MTKPTFDMEAALQALRDGKIDVRDYCIPTTTKQKEVAHG